MNVNLPATVHHDAPARFTQDQVGLIKRTICKGATDDELKLFMAQCERTGLDPFSRQIYSLERRTKNPDGQWVTTRSIQVSIDGFRLVAERSGKYAGQVGPYWCGADGQWQDVWLSAEPPKAARVGVLRDDFKEPCWGVARYDSYVQKLKDGAPTRMWATMPDVMLAKCAESLALRKAFPQELAGLYTADEMDQATTVVEDAKPSPVQPQAIAAPVHPETGELSPHTIKRGKDPIAWGGQYIAALKATTLLSDLGEWAEANKETLEIIADKHPQTFKLINAAAKLRMDELSKPLEMDAAE